MSHHDGKLGGKVIINGFIKPFSDNEQLSEVGNGKIPLPARWQFGVFGGPKKGSLANRGVPILWNTLFMAALAYPFRKNGICTRTRGALSENFRPFVVENRLRAAFSRRIYAIRVQK